MTVLIILLVLVVSLISVAWVAGRRHAARRDHEAIGDAAARGLYDRYLCMSKRSRRRTCFRRGGG